MCYRLRCCRSGDVVPMVCHVSGFASGETLPAETLAKRFAVVPGSVPWAACCRWWLCRSARLATSARLDLSADLCRCAVLRGAVCHDCATLHRDKPRRRAITQPGCAPHDATPKVLPLLQRLRHHATSRLRRALHDATPTVLLLSRNASHHARTPQMQTPMGFAIIPRVGTVGVREISCGGREPKNWLVFLIFLWISFTFEPAEAHALCPHTRTRVLLKRIESIYSHSDNDDSRITGEIRFFQHFTHTEFFHR